MKGVAQTGWEQRGSNSYYYRKEREASRVKSVYVGREEMGHMISQFESSSADLEKLMRAKKSIEADELEKVEGVAVELTQLATRPPCSSI